MLCLAPMASAQSEVEADSLRLDSILTTMGELTVQGERPLVRAEADRLVYDLPRLVENKAVDNIYDALKYLPGITEQNETLSLGGRSFAIIIDDKPQALTAEQLNALLRAMPISRLKSAEVMLSAPPRYGVRGAAINLRLNHESALRTLQGEVLGQYRHRHLDDFVQRGSLLWNHNRFSLDALYQHTHGRTYDITDKEARHTLLVPSVQESVPEYPLSPLDVPRSTQVIPLSMHQVSRGRNHEHQFRIGLDVDFSRLSDDSRPGTGSVDGVSSAVASSPSHPSVPSRPHRLSLTYYATLTTSHNNNISSGSQTSTTHIDRSKTLHDLRLDYQLPFGLTATAELTDYNSPTSETLRSDLLGSVLNLATDSRQHITRYRLHLDQQHNLPHSWTLNYGAYFTHSHDRSRQNYSPLQPSSLAAALPRAPQDTQSFFVRGGSAAGPWLASSLLSTDAPSSAANVSTLPPSLSSSRNEHTINFYSTLSHNFSARLMTNASLAVEHYATPERRRWDFYPVLNITYLPANDHILQFSIGSDKDYPSYWALQNTTSYMGRYSEIQGTPDLRPSREYSASLQYILKNKYILSLNYAYTDDYFVQLLYQSPRRLVEIYRNVNFRYLQQLNLHLSVPFKAGRWLDSRLTFIAAHDRIRLDDYFSDEAAMPASTTILQAPSSRTPNSEGITTSAAAPALYSAVPVASTPLRRTKLFCMAVLNATFTLPTPSFLRQGTQLHLIVDGFARTAGIQGLYDLPASGNLDLKLRYTFPGNRARIVLFCRDLFRTAGISPRIDYDPGISEGVGSAAPTPQYVVNHYSCFRAVGITASFNFGNYKEKKREAVDTSRFR